MTRPSYFSLNKEERRTICFEGQVRFGISPIGLEKDVWICWALDTLFRLPSALPMAFKGGTSLSKVFNVINRLSEDVDVTVDFRNLGSIPPDGAVLSGNQRKKLRESLERALKEQVAGKVLSWMREEAHRQFGSSAPNLFHESSDGCEKLLVQYPSAFHLEEGKSLDPFDGAYIRPEVILEFGGRNSTEPKESHTVDAYLAELYPKVAFPSARVAVLSPKRTFWEKATLVHLECNKPPHRTEGKGERIARHWADLAALADHRIGREAILDAAIAESVVRHKSVYFFDHDANYGACLSGGLRLVPSPQRRRDLEKDFHKMEGMFQSGKPDFEAIMDRLGRLESEINGRMRDRGAGGSDPDRSGGRRP